MPSVCRLSRRAAGLRALAATLLLLGASPAAAQSIGIDFGRTSGEDTLLGGRPSGAPAVSGGSNVREPYHGERRARSQTRWSESPPLAERRSGDPVGSWRHGARPSLSVQHVHAAPRSSYFRGTGVFANAQGTSGSVVYYQRPSLERDDAWGTGPKVIDVASQRLDRQPIGPGGISVHYVGSTKIIRLASATPAHEGEAAEKDMAALPQPDRTPSANQEREVLGAPRPSPRPRSEPLRAAPVQEPARAETAPSLEPWTDEWLADCVARHESFDASLGTYTDENGQRRFCTGDPA